MPRITVLALSALMLTAAPAFAQDGETRSMVGVIPGYEPGPLEGGLADLEARMAEFGARMEAIEADRTLTPEQRRDHHAETWRTLSPDIIALSASAAETAGTAAATMVASMNIEGLVAAALTQANLALSMASIDIEAALAEAFAEIMTSRPPKPPWADRISDPA